MLTAVDRDGMLIGTVKKCLFKPTPLPTDHSSVVLIFTTKTLTAIKGVGLDRHFTVTTLLGWALQMSYVGGEVGFLSAGIAQR